MNDKPYDPDYSAAFATPPAGPHVGPQLTEYTGNRIASALERIADAMGKAPSSILEPTGATLSFDQVKSGVIALRMHVYSLYGEAPPSSFETAVIDVVHAVATATPPTVERAASGGGVQSYTDMRASMTPQGPAVTYPLGDPAPFRSSGEVEALVYGIAEAVKGMQPDTLRVHLPESFTVTSNKAT